jgi:hypothetical protein
MATIFHPATKGSRLHRTEMIGAGFAEPTSTNILAQRVR